jgi:hypothetical protein
MIEFKQILGYLYVCVCVLLWIGEKLLIRLDRNETKETLDYGTAVRIWPSIGQYQLSQFSDALPNTVVFVPPHSQIISSFPPYCVLYHIFTSHIITIGPFSSDPLSFPTFSSPLVYMLNYGPIILSLIRFGISMVST